MEQYFATRLELWYETHGRDLPWRRTNDPYLIMLSEFILQQTQVSQGMDYYLRFAERYPTAGHLAAASEEEVLLLWQGLGYYSRARHLHAAAKLIDKAGCFPKDYTNVRALPGVGDYTAAAIMSFAFGLPYAVLDGNVQRVLSRHFGISEPVDTAKGKKLLRTLADEMLDHRHSALYNQAIMDFGALQCKPSAPACAVCPLAESCIALAEHTVDVLPYKSKRIAVRDRFLTYIYICTADGYTLLRRRGGGDIWQGLFEFPLIESERPLTPAEVERHVLDAKAFGPALQSREDEDISTCGHRLTAIARDVRHLLTHQRLHADFYCLTLPQRTLVQGATCNTPRPVSEASAEECPMHNVKWVHESELDRYALPRLLLKLLERLTPQK